MNGTVSSEKEKALKQTYNTCLPIERTTEKEDGLPEAEDREKDVPEEDMLEEEG